MPTHQLGPYLYLGAFLAAIVANDYLPFSNTINLVCAVAVFALECYIAHRIVSHQKTLESRSP
jgi:hypothetical protein